MVEWCVSDKLESVSKEEVLPQLKNSTSIWLEWPMETTKALNQNHWWPNRNKEWHLPNTNLQLNEPV
jgi:hypothetical protein